MNLTDEQVKDLKGFLGNELEKKMKEVAYDPKKLPEVITEIVKEQVKELEVKKGEGEVPLSGEDAKPKFKSFGEQLQSVAKAELSHGRDVDPRLIDVAALNPQQKAAYGLNEIEGAEGGFLVEPQYNMELMKRTHETWVVAKDCRRIPMSSTRLVFNVIDEASRANGSRWGGILAYWTAEAGTKQATKPKFRQIELGMNKLTGLCYATDELLADAAALESIITQGFAEEFGFKVDDAIINGTGAGMPLGILNCAALKTVPSQPGQGASTVVAENIINMWNGMPAKVRTGAKWYVIQDVEPELDQIYLALGTGAIPLYLPVVGGQPTLAEESSGRLKGKPVIPIEQCQALGTAGDIILANFQEYILVERGAMESASSIHVRFINDETTFRFVYRVDGQPLWNTTLTSFRSVTRSPFVVLNSSRT